MALDRALHSFTTHFMYFVKNWSEIVAELSNTE